MLKTLILLLRTYLPGKVISNDVIIIQKLFQSNILESFTCGGSSSAGSLSLESVDESASEKLTALAGYQFVRKLECPNTWEYKAEKQVPNRLIPQAHFQLFFKISSASLQQKGMPQSYIDQLKPVGIVMTAGHVTVANGASCDECATQPDVKLGLIDAAGTESITTYKMKLMSSGYQEDRCG